MGKRYRKKFIKRLNDLKGHTYEFKKSVIQNMLAGATRYAWVTSPYLIIDNDLCTDFENTALRGVDVRIIVPHIPDKKIIFAMTRSFLPPLDESRGKDL